MRKRNLDQVMRVRGLLEDLARAELEMRSQAVRELEEAAAGQRGGALAIRREGWEQLAQSEPGRKPCEKSGQEPGQESKQEARQPAEQHDRGPESAWRLGLRDAEILEGRSRRLRVRAEAEKPAVVEARDAMLERRRERQQMETLVEAARCAEAQERVRREQQQVDDWFQGRATKGTARAGAAPRRED